MALTIANPYEKLVDFYHDNPALMELYQWKETEIYQEIVLFLNDFNSDWRKAKELGEYAADFILGIITDFEDVDEKDCFTAWLTSIYEEIADRYATTKSNYQFARIEHEQYETQSFIADFYEFEVSDEDFENAYQNYQQEKDNKIHLSF